MTQWDQVQRKYTPKLVKVEMIFKVSRVELHHNMLKMTSLKVILRLITSPRICQRENSNPIYQNENTGCMIHKI